MYIATLNGLSVKVTTHLSLVLRSGKHGALHPRPLYVSSNFTFACACVGICIRKVIIGTIKCSHFIRFKFQSGSSTPSELHASDTLIIDSAGKIIVIYFKL
jgi:hypothetical protein